MVLHKEPIHRGLKSDPIRGRRYENMRRNFISILAVLMLMGLLGLAKTSLAAEGTWTQKADMPTARWGLSASMVDGKIYAIGGVGSLKKVEEYDPATDTWTEKTDMPTGRVFLATSVVDGKIYAIGGATAFHGGTTLGAVEEYDPATDTWTKKADIPVPRERMGTGVVNGKIYAIGGYAVGGGLGEVTVATVWEYDPATDTWAKKSDMPTTRALAAANVVNGKIYVIGGVISNVWPAFSTVEEYDPVTDTWTKKTDMPALRSTSTSVVDEKIYAFGGFARRGGAPFSTLFQYDPATDTWTAKDEMPLRVGGMGISAVDGKIYIIGGSSVGFPYQPSISTVWEYDTGFVPIPLNEK
jgi:N-acetylneuraminic acid mutarotase